jgi:hypothetical protein
VKAIVEELATGRLVELKAHVGMARDVELGVWEDEQGCFVSWVGCPLPGYRVVKVCILGVWI